MYIVSLHLQKYNPIIIVPTFFDKNYEKHRGGALRQGARSPRERCLACLILIGSVCKHSNFPIKAHRCSCRHGGYFTGRHGSLPLQSGTIMLQRQCCYTERAMILYGKSIAPRTVGQCSMGYKSSALWGIKALLRGGQKQCFVGDNGTALWSAGVLCYRTSSKMVLTPLIFSPWIWRRSWRKRSRATAT